MLTSVQGYSKYTEDGDPELTVRSKIWFEDGNVILEAEGIQFKVHRGILSESSSVFKDMFTLPQPPSMDEELIDGCPIVHLSDTAEEVTYMLEALCQRKCVTYNLKQTRYNIGADCTNLLVVSPDMLLCDISCPWPSYLRSLVWAESTTSKHCTPRPR